MALSVADSVFSSLGIRFEGACVDAMVAELRFLMLNTSSEPAGKAQENRDHFLIEHKSTPAESYSREFRHGASKGDSREAEMVSWATLDVGVALREKFASKLHTPGNTFAQCDGLLHASRRVMSGVCAALARELDQHATATNITSNTEDDLPGRFILTTERGSAARADPTVIAGGGGGTAVGTKAAAGSAQTVTDTSPPNSPHRGDKGDSYVVFEATSCTPKKVDRRANAKLEQLENVCGLLRARHAATQALKSQECPFKLSTDKPGWMNRQTKDPVSMHDVQQWIIANATAYQKPIGNVISLVAIGVPGGVSAAVLKCVRDKLERRGGRMFPHLRQLHQGGQFAVYGLTSNDWSRSESDAAASVSERLRRGLEVYRAQLHEKIREKDTALQEKDAALREASGLREQLYAAQLDAALQKQRADHLQAQSTTAQDRSTKLEAQLRTAQHQSTKLEAQLRTAQHQSTKLEAQLYSAQQRIDELRENAAATQRELFSEVVAALRTALPPAAGPNGAGRAADGSS